MRKVTSVLAIGVGAAGMAIVWVANLFGLWWVAVPVGLVIGVLVPRGRMAVGVAALAGALGWALPLAVGAISLPIGRTASAVGGIMFGTGAAAPVVILTVLLGLLLCVAGAWVAVALRLVLPARTAQGRSTSTMGSSRGSIEE